MDYEMEFQEFSPNPIGRADLLLGVFVLLTRFFSGLSVLPYLKFWSRC